MGIKGYLLGIAGLLIYYVICFILGIFIFNRLEWKKLLILYFFIAMSCSWILHGMLCRKYNGDNLRIKVGGEQDYIIQAIVIMSLPCFLLFVSSFIFRYDHVPSLIVLTAIFLTSISLSLLEKKHMKKYKNKRI